MWVVVGVLVLVAVEVEVLVLVAVGVGVLVGVGVDEAVAVGTGWLRVKATPPKTPQGVPAAIPVKSSQRMSVVDQVSQAPYCKVGLSRYPMTGIK